MKKSPRATAITEKLSQCQFCLCMTKTIKHQCGKCKKIKIPIRKAKDVLEKTLDMEASASVARNRLEVQVFILEKKLEKALEALKEIVSENRTGKVAEIARESLSLLNEEEK